MLAFPDCIASRHLFIAFVFVVITASAKETVYFINYFIDSWKTTLKKAAMLVAIFVRLTYFLHLLDCLNSFIVKENEDFTSAAKVIECSLAAVGETFVAYIQGANQEHFD